MTLSTKVNMAKMTDLIAYSGGKENIISVSHCITRLRLMLRNTLSIDIAAIKKLSFVKGCLLNGDQLQIIIGINVTQYYRALMTQMGTPTTLEAQRNHVSILNQCIAYLAEIFIPLLPVLISGGLLLGMRNIIGDIPIIHNQSLMQIYPWLKSLYDFLWLPCEAIFYFLPVAVCWSTVQKTGGTPILGIILGLSLVSPQLVSFYESTQHSVELWHFGFFSIEKIGYQSQVVPTLLAGVALSLSETQLKKILPPYLHLILVPLIALISSLVLAFAILGPFGRMLGTAISKSIQLLMLGDFAPIGSVIFGFCYAPLVLTGLHHLTLALDLQMTVTQGGTPLWPIIALSNVAQASAVVGLLCHNKTTTVEREIMLPAALSAYLGVTEPAMYAINLPRRFPMICAMLGTALAALVCGVNRVLSNGIGVGGLPAILSIQPSFWGSYLAALLVAISIPLLATAFVYHLNRTKNHDQLIYPKGKI